VHTLEKLIEQNIRYLQQAEPTAAETTQSNHG
jgi:hypothetical protein